MNIALFTDSYLPTKSGVVTVVEQIYQNLKALGHHVVIVTVANPLADIKNESDDILRVPSTKIGLGMKDQYFGYPFLKKISQFLKKNKIELIHCHTEFTIGLNAIHEAKKLRIPIICTTHTMWEDYYKYYLPGANHLSPEIIRWLVSKFYNRMYALINVSDKAHQYFKQNDVCPNIPSAIIPNSINTVNYCHEKSSDDEKAELKESLGISKNEKVILYVGRIVEEKRIFELVDILDEVLSNNSDCKVLFVGDGAAFKHTKKIVSTSKNSDRFIFTGFIDWHKIHLYYEIADIFVSSSLSEMHSMTILEALTSGLPVIVRKDSSYNDTVINDYNGYQSDSDEQMSKDILKLLNEPENLKKFSSNSLILSQNFLPEIFIKKHLEFYKTVLETWKSRKKLTDDLLDTALDKVKING